ncbi:hypothetical protein [Streptomyces jumonjinensis]|nr:hypothetical protein [Streptomyces jumonjinensis]
MRPATGPGDPDGAKVLAGQAYDSASEYAAVTGGGCGPGGG